MKLILIVFTLFFTACASKPVALPVTWSNDCRNVPNTKARVCFYRTGEKPARTLWYWPGLLETASVLERSLFDEQGFRDLITALGPINVVVVGYGSGYYIRPPMTAGNPSFKEITEKVIPFVERTFSPVKPYIGLGISEGAANLITISLLKPEMFTKTVAVHPMVVREDQGPDGFCRACWLLRANFTAEEWKVASPFYLARKAPSMSPMMMVACKKDQFKLYEGARELADVMRMRSMPLLFVDDAEECSHIGWRNEPILDYFK